MILKSVSIRNFRSVQDETLECENLTALAGANGCGKSTFLRALDLFYSASARVDAEDFYNRDVNAEISVAVEYTGLSEEAKERFSKYLQADTLIVERAFRMEQGRVVSSFHGASLQNPEFENVRNGLLIKDRGKTARTELDALRTHKKYEDLGTSSTLSGIESILSQWEANHLNHCTRQRDDGKFFGFSSVGQGYLGRYTRFLFIPAIREAADDGMERKGSILTELMDLLVRSVIASKKEFVTLKEETQQRYNAIMQVENLKELSALSDQLSGTLKTFVPTARVSLTWLPPEEVYLAMPQADVKLEEDRYSTSVHRTGHGLQRAFILTMLQHMAMAKRAMPEIAEGQEPGGDPENDADTPDLDLILAIEEPELFQHPNRQRHLANIFLQLATGKLRGVAKNTQIIYATHSPLFISLDRFDQIRILRKVENGKDLPKVTRVVSAKLQSIAEKLWIFDGEKGEVYTAATLKQRLHSILTPSINEGFFARIAVLVEGDDDYAAIKGMARAMGVDLEGLGVSTIPVGGKRSLDRPALIFREFGIPIFIVWDSDGGKGETKGKCDSCGKDLDGKPDPEDNRRLLRILGMAEEDWPNYLETSFCCFPKDLESTLSDEIGADRFEELLTECQAEFGVPKRKHARKNPNVIAAIIDKARAESLQSKTLENIVNRIVAMAELETSKLN